MHEDQDERRRGGAERRLPICRYIWWYLNLTNGMMPIEQWKFLHRKYILKKKKKLWGNYAIWFGFFDKVSLVIFSESISSVLIKIWYSAEILKLIWPKKVTLAKLNSTLGSVVPLAMFRNIISAFNLIAYCSQTQGKAVWSYKITFSYYEREICQHRQLKVRPGPMKSFLSWPHGHHQF